MHEHFIQTLLSQRFLNSSRIATTATTIPGVGLWRKLVLLWWTNLRDSPLEFQGYDPRG
jgi:hypothetical protein